MHGINLGCAPAEITISTYNACRDRAYTYLTEEVDFVKTVKGPKIRAFYFNIVDPEDKRHVTIDGHMAAAYRNHSGTMKENIIRRSTYLEIQDAVKQLAKRTGLIPIQVQAIIWFTRKRVLNVKYDGQMDMFGQPDNRWNTLMDITSIKPYERNPNGRA